MTFWKWSQTASSNATADSTVNWAEGQAPSSVNDSARAMMAAAAKYRDDVSGTKISTGGSADAYSVTSNQGLTALTDGFRVAFICSATNTGASTINVDSLGAKPLRKLSGAALSAGELVSGSVYEAVYDSGNDEWLIPGGRLAPFLPAGIVLPYAGATAPSNTLLCYGQAISRTTYAALFTAIGTAYGTGDGSTTFNLPDLRGRSVAGKDDMGGSAASRLTSTYFGTSAASLGAAGGTESVTLTSAQSGQKAISAAPVTVTDPGHTHTGAIAGGSTTYQTGTGAQGATSGSSTTGITATFTLAGSSAASAHATVPPTLILNYIITF